MKWNRTGRWWVAAAVVAVVAVVGQSLQGSVTTMKGKGKVKGEHFFQKFVSGGATEDIYTVSAIRTFVITDLVLWNPGGTPTSASVKIQGGATLIPSLPVPASGHFAHAFNVGPEVGPGETLQVSNLTGGSSLQVYLAGYVKK
jgi:hypothetical protein